MFFRGTQAFSAKIFDAEKALITTSNFYGRGDRAKKVQKSLMPKGVDHDDKTFSDLISHAVQKSLMPKGVDHHIKFIRAGRSGQVQKSLMPKGVDHRKNDISASICQCAKIFDAERR